MDLQTKQDVIAKLQALGLTPFDSWLLTQQIELPCVVKGSPDSEVEYSDEARRQGLRQFDSNGVIQYETLCLETKRLELRRRYYPSGRLLSEEICVLESEDLDFEFVEFVEWFERGGLKSIHVRVSKTDKQRISWNDDGTVISQRLNIESEALESLVCLGCGAHTLFESFGHAGFGEAGFMYNDSGRHVIRWDADDPAYLAIVGNERFFPWMISDQQKADFERCLKVLPDGTRFRFSNPARCGECARQIMSPLPQCSYIVFPENTIWTTAPKRFSNAAGHQQAVLLTDCLTPSD